MSATQPGILAPVPRLARHLFFALKPGTDTETARAALLRRMVGVEDGIGDALFSFTRPISGAYFWCPPLREGKLDLRALGL